jgi:hypothetical protein
MMQFSMMSTGCPPALQDTVPMLLQKYHVSKRGGQANKFEPGQKKLGIECPLAFHVRIALSRTPQEGLLDSHCLEDASETLEDEEVVEAKDVDELVRSVFVLSLKITSVSCMPFDRRRVQEREMLTTKHGLAGCMRKRPNRS